MIAVCFHSLLEYMDGKYRRSIFPFKIAPLLVDQRSRWDEDVPRYR